MAHRGASHRAPENTLSALRSALALGADMVEVDVRRTADGALVLVHDGALDRTTDVAHRFPRRAPWRVRDMTLAEVGTLDAGTWKSSTFAGEHIPTLEESLAVMLRAGSRLLLEIKQPAEYPGIMTEVAEVLRATKRLAPRTPASVVVQSFDTVAVRAFARECPGIPVGVLSPVPAHELPEVATWASYVNPHHRLVHRGYVQALHAAGLRCLPWTADDPSRLRRLLRAGVDGVISNRPDLVRGVASVPMGVRPAD